MRNLVVFFHLAAAIFWMGGMAFMVLALRAPVSEMLQPPERLRLLAAVLARFFAVVAVSIGALLATGLSLMFGLGAGRAPPGWHAMAGLGLVMMLIFGHLYFSPFQRLKAAVAASAWPEAGRRMEQITLLAKVNLGLGWLAIAAVMLWH